MSEMADDDLLLHYRDAIHELVEIEADEECLFIDVPVKHLRRLLSLGHYGLQRKCVGGCDRTQPALQDSKFGQRFNVGPWICQYCHEKLCGSEFIELGHKCKATKLL